MDISKFKVESITPSIGAKISVVSLNKDLNSATVEKIYSALIKHLVIFFRVKFLLISKKTVINKFPFLEIHLLPRWPFP